MSQLAVLMFEHGDRDLSRDRDGQAVHTIAAKNCRDGELVNKYSQKPNRIVQNGPNFIPT